MARRLFTIEDRFMIEGHGLVPLPGIVPESEERFRVGNLILLKRPGGSEIEWRIGGLELLNRLPPQNAVVISLKGLRKDDIPVGTEVWSVDRYACPCCGYKTLDEKPPGTYDICRVCYWEDDLVQFSNPDNKGGANAVSLREAQRRFMESGVCELRFKEYVREPRAGEERDPNWKPLDGVPTETKR
jgi:hypothetical protein